MSETLEKVWGYKVGDCAWCPEAPATTSYEDYIAGGELAEYQVCAICREEYALYVGRSGLMAKCMKCGCAVDYTSSADGERWSCQRCGQPTSERVE